MKILFVVPYPPSRVRVRPYHLLLTLLERGHDVTLATLHSSADELSDVEQLERSGIRVLSRPHTRLQSFQSSLRALPTGQPLQAWFSWSPPFARMLREAAANGYELAHVEHLRGARYALALRGRLPVVWDAVDSMTHLFTQASTQSRTARARLIARFELPRTRSVERTLPSRVDGVVVSAPVDRDAFLSLLPDPSLASRVSIVPNGVDTEYFRAGVEPPDPNRIIFAGRLSYHANVAAALHLLDAIMPRVWRVRPRARLMIVGQNPPPALRAAAAGIERVELTGTVPDLRPYLQRAAVAVAPIVYGAGIQNKVLQAMSMSRPVVATSPAVAALRARPGRDYLRDDSPDAFAEGIARLLDDGRLRAELGANGRRYVEREHQWSRMAARLDRTYDAALRNGRTVACAASG